MKLDLTYIGHPVLRQKVRPVEHLDADVLALIAHMKETLQAYRGLGLAAPQVGASLAFFLTCFPNVMADGSLSLGDIRVFINPKIEDPSEESWVEEEGCLSIPKVYAFVRRPTAITITASDEHGNVKTERLQGWPAKIVMHENDHLNGVLFVDRIDGREKKQIHHELERLKKHFKTHNEHVKLWKGSK
jgi:peptide deformylase